MPLSTDEGPKKPEGKLKKAHGLTMRARACKNAKDFANAAKWFLEAADLWEQLGEKDTAVACRRLAQEYESELK